MISTRLFELLIATLLIFFAKLEPCIGAPNGGQYCNSVQCEKTASELLSSMNRSVVPCNDFYEHACGGWIAKNPITDPTAGRISRFDDLTLKIHTQIAESFKTIKPNDIEALQKAKKFYDSCMDWDTIERRGLSPLKAILTENGEWPLIVPADKWNPKHLTWLQIHENIVKRVDIPSLFDVDVTINDKDSNNHIISLTIAELPYTRLELLLRSKRSARRNDYRKYIPDVAKAFKDSKVLSADQKKFNNDIQEIIKFENNLLEIANLGAKTDDDDTNYLRIMTIAALQTEWDAAISKKSGYAVDWLKVISDKFAGTGIVINKSDKVAVQPATFATKLAKLLIGTPVKTIVNFMQWRMIDKLIHLTNSKLSNPGLLPVAGVGRSGKCINDHKMPHAVAYLYVTKHSSKATTLSALKIAGHVQDEMKREIQQSAWLDAATKSAAREKVDAMTNSIGYPEWYDKSGEMDKYYNDLTVGHDYFENAVLAMKFDSKIKLLRLRSPATKGEILGRAYPHIVNAQYEPPTNSLKFPSAILQAPLFVDGSTSVLNYGAFGAFVGHEVSHGFDNLGRLYDKNGNSKKWWPQSAIDTYDNKAKCFIGQFDKYLIYENRDKKKIYVDGTYTQRENIADSIGFRIGFRAFETVKNSKDINKSKSRLLADISDEQLYFYQLAQAFCETVSEKGLKGYESDPHTPNRYRINGALSNAKEFADAFKCPAGSPMHPTEKCTIWG